MTRLATTARKAGTALAALLAAGPASAGGDASRGAVIVADRALGLCTLCHAVPGQPAALQGTIGPPLAGIGARQGADALRQRLLAPQRFNPDTVMPAYGEVPPAHALQRVPPALRGQPLLSPAQLDDVVAYLVSLQ